MRCLQSGHKSMKQMGLKGTGSTAIDDFTYNYKNNEVSNKLLTVTESTAINTADNKLGDFTDKNRTMDDYDYDANGNLAYDKNKNISTIIYNYLNLPWVITLPNKGTITYTYDATGNKIKKVTADNSVTAKTITTTTTYLGGFVYESKTTVPANNPNDDYRDKLLFTFHTFIPEK
jgi:YD repeat-containing protein